MDFALPWYTTSERECVCVCERERGKKERQPFLFLFGFFFLVLLFFEGCLQEDERNNELRKIRRRKKEE